MQKFEGGCRSNVENLDQNEPRNMFLIASNRSRLCSYNYNPTRYWDVRIDWDQMMELNLFKTTIMTSTQTEDVKQVDRGELAGRKSS